MDRKADSSRALAGKYPAYREHHPGILFDRLLRERELSKDLKKRSLPISGKPILSFSFRYILHQSWREWYSLHRGALYQRG
jgi:hypothetical protein